MNNNKITLNDIEQRLNETGMDLENRILKFISNINNSIYIADKCYGIINEPSRNVQFDCFIDLTEFFGIHKTSPNQFDYFGLIYDRNQSLYEKLVELIEKVSKKFKSKELTRLFFGEYYDNPEMQHFLDIIDELDERIIKPFFYSTISSLLLNDEYAKFILNL